MVPGLSFQGGKSKCLLKNIRGGMPWIILIGACLEGKRESWQVQRWKDSGSHLKMEKKGQGGASSQIREWMGACSAYCGGREKAAQRSWTHELHLQPDSTAGRHLLQFSAESGRWDTACFPLHLPVWPPSPTQPMLLLYCTLPVSVFYSSLTEVSYYPSIRREGGPNSSCKWLNSAFPFNSLAQPPDSSLPQTCKIWYQNVPQTQKTVTRITGCSTAAAVSELWAVSSILCSTQLLITG